MFLFPHCYLQLQLKYVLFYLPLFPSLSFSFSSSSFYSPLNFQFLTLKNNPQRSIYYQLCLTHLGQGSHVCCHPLLPHPSHRTCFCYNDFAATYLQLSSVNQSVQEQQKGIYISFSSYTLYMYLWIKPMYQASFFCIVFQDLSQLAPHHLHDASSLLSLKSFLHFCQFYDLLCLI